MLKLALQRLWRQARSGEYRLLLAALVLAAASTTAVDGLVSRSARLLSAEVGALLASDAVLRSSEPIRPERLQSATAAGLQTARTAQFRSMLGANGRFVLCDLKAVDSSYPLRGRLELGSTPVAASGASASSPHPAPQPGEVWLDAAVAERLGLELGAPVQVGNLTPRFAGYIWREPDRGSDFLGFAPRALMAYADLASSELLGPGSRASFRLLLAGPATELDRWIQQTTPRLSVHESWFDVEQEQGAVQRTLARARQFLDLASLTVVLVAGLAVALAAERLGHRQRSTIALMRCWGASRATIVGLLAVELLGLGLVAWAAGSALGLALQGVIAGLLLPSVAQGSGIDQASSALVGFKVTAITLLICAGPNILALSRVAPAETLRLGPSPVLAGRHFVVGGLLLAALLLPWSAEARALSGWMLAGLAGLALILALAGAMLMRLARGLSLAASGPVRQGLAGLARRRGGLLQLVALGLSMSLMLVLTLVQGELFASWKQTLGPGTPNHFIINIQPGEDVAVRALLARHGVPAPELYPMIRGRLVAVDGVPLNPEALPAGRARQLALREFNLSIASRPQRDNQVVAGHFWPRVGAIPAQFSAEVEVAELLGFGLGQDLQFSVAGQTVNARVTSLRRVQWDSFNVNFFVVAPPGVLEGLPLTWVTSFHLPSEHRAAFTRALLRDHPSATLIDVETQIATLQGLVNRAGQALSGVFVLAMVGAVLVLQGAIALTQSERQREAALLIALGGTRARLLLSLGTEFAALGLLAGSAAAIAAAIIGEVIALQVFDLHYTPGIGLLLGPVIAVIGVTTIGLMATQSVLQTPPARILATETG